MSVYIPDASSYASDDEDVSNLMCLLDDPVDLDTRSKRLSLSKRVALINFTVNENGDVIYRDSQVLGAHTGIRLPSEMLDSERILLSIFLDYELPLSISSTVSAPEFVDLNLKRTHNDISVQNNIGKHQLWIRPSELDDDGIVFFKSRLWQLSQGFRTAAGVRWPKFVICATAYRNNVVGIVSSKESYLSPNFEVRSKEQSNKTRAARGESEPIRRRRTPETEARAAKLREVQSKIMDLRSDIESENRKTSEYETRLNFIRAIAGTCSESGEILSLL